MHPCACNRQERQLQFDIAVECRPSALLPSLITPLPCARSCVFYHNERIRLVHTQEKPRRGWKRQYFTTSTTMALSAPRTVEDIYADYNNRRSGLLKALTAGMCVWVCSPAWSHLHLARSLRSLYALLADVDELYKLADPDRDNLCLYGKPFGQAAAARKATWRQ